MAAAGIDASKLAFVLQYFDTTYIRTPPGMLKIAQLVSRHTQKISEECLRFILKGIEYFHSVKYDLITYVQIYSR